MNLVVDVHAHVLIRDAELLVSCQPEFVQDDACNEPESVEANSGGRLLRPLVDLGTRLSRMDAVGVDIQAVSVVPSQYYSWADRILSGELVELLNSEIAKLVRRAPDRLVGVATVALQHPDQAAEQLRRSVDDYDFRGVQIPTRAGGRALSHPDLDPFWSIAESLGVPVFIHPERCWLGNQLSAAHWTDAVSRTTRITQALSHLVFGGVLDRFPGLAVCGAYGGGHFPRSLQDADQGYDLRPSSRTMKCRPSDYLSHLYFDSLVPDSDALRQLVDVAGRHRVLLGSNYPFELKGGPPLQLIDMLTTDERAAISGPNAGGLLRINGVTRPNR